MSSEIIALIILIGSLIGMVVIIWRKLPILAELPEEVKNSRENLFFWLKNKIVSRSFIKDFNFPLFLQKILSKIWVFVLKIENKVASWLQKLREKSQKQKNFEDDKYWQKLKNLTNNKTGKKKKSN
jgi:hypothetical protein